MAGFVPSQVGSLVCAEFPQALVARKLPEHAACFLAKTFQPTKRFVTATRGINFQLSGQFFPSTWVYAGKPWVGVGGAALSLGPRDLDLD